MTSEQATMARHARTIVEHHLNCRVRRAEPLGGGITNHVFRVRYEGGQVIVRLGVTGGKVEAFLKEHWALEKAASAGVPVVRVLQVGSDVIDTPYMIEECAGGHVATEHSDRLGIVRQMGEIAARIHGIPTSGFGQTFDWSQNTLSRCETWREYLEGQLDWEARVAALTKAGVLPSDRAKRLQAAFGRVIQLEPAPALNHGDLRLKNLLVDDGGKVVAVIDWEDCQSNAPRIWEFALALHDMGVDEKEAFLKGYGLTPDEAIELAPYWAALNLVLYSDHVTRAADSNDAAALRWFRTRLSGAFDLYTT